MKNSEFEEKEFEGPLYNQLEQGTNLLWQPGQVFEKHIGIDRCNFIDDVNIWKQIGLSTPPPGVCLSRYDWGYIWVNKPKRKKLPSFRLNLFIQAKRSQFGNTPKKMMNYNFGKTCYKFNMVQHQQDALEKVATNLKNRALVCYAAPMFSKDSELQKHTINSSIIENTTFPEINKLKGHSSWYYNRKVNGVANIEPNPIQAMGILDRVENYYKENENYPNEMNFSENLGDLRNIIYKTLGQFNENGVYSPRIGQLFNKRNELRNIIKYIEIDDVTREELAIYYEIALFTTIFNLDWLTVGKYK